MEHGTLALLILAVVGIVLLVIWELTHVLYALQHPLDALIALVEKLGEVRDAVRRVFPGKREAAAPELKPSVPAQAQGEDEPASTDST
ncbi:hypothetical protein ACFWG0_27750 [Streptomyces yangpuensis]|uniref:hypothetical protein n=1 Tax=Streptomyces yangpuensis TaxID=1648182 RepID=UPI003652F7B2